MMLESAERNKMRELYKQLFDCSCGRMSEHRFLTICLGYGSEIEGTWPGTQKIDVVGN